MTYFTSLYIHANDAESIYVGGLLLFVKSQINGFEFEKSVSFCFKRFCLNIS